MKVSLRKALVKMIEEKKERQQDEQSPSGQIKSVLPKRKKKDQL